MNEGIKTSVSDEISIAIVAYQNYDEIKDAIKTLESFTDAGLSKKIYIVDNGSACSSPDDISAFLSYIHGFEDVTYISAGQNLGFGRGHNYVINQLDSKYHVIMNPDILFCEDALSKIIQWMDAHPDVGMVIPEIDGENGERQLVYREELTVADVAIRFFFKKLFPKRVAKHTMQDRDYSVPFQVPFGQGSFLVIRTELFKELDGFDDNFFMYVEDADLCKRVNQVSKLMYYPGAKVIHKWKMESHHNKVLFKYHVSSLRYYFKKWGYKLF